MNHSFGYLIAILCLTTGCYQTRDSFTDDDLLNGSGSTRFLAARDVLRLTCSGGGCHGSGSIQTPYAAWSSEATFISSGKVVTTGTPCNSPMYARVKGSLCGAGGTDGSSQNMPQGSQLSTTQLLALSEWIRCLGTGQPGC